MFRGGGSFEETGYCATYNDETLASPIARARIGVSMMAARKRRTKTATPHARVKWSKFRWRDSVRHAGSAVTAVVARNNAIAEAIDD